MFVCDVPYFMHLLHSSVASSHTHIKIITICKLKNTDIKSDKKNIKGPAVIVCYKKALCCIKSIFELSACL
jgi:hypothetical protein